jgi:hypothetical protein
MIALLSLAPAAGAVDDDKIRQAIDGGVAYLKKQQQANGGWQYLTSSPGATALAGLTLLECDVDSQDAAVQKAAKALRPESIGLTKTYHLSLGVLFLDRLGDAADDVLIQSMTVRLLAGQNADGGWGYDCPPLNRNEVQRLQTLLRKRNEPSGRREAPRPALQPQRERPAVPAEIQIQLKQVNARVRLGPSDNSNTKFATLALWVGRRHAMPVDKALDMVETRFRGSQNGDGGWGYVPRQPGNLGQSYGTMTCAGLLGLAIGHVSAKEAKSRAGVKDNDTPSGTAKPARNLSEDPAIRAGLLTLTNLLDRPIDKPGPIALFNPNGDEYYFLWALERVAVAYSLETIGDRDWYAWGSEILLDRQKRDGSWQGRYGGVVDSCFAMLFLKRANLSKDLTATLRGQILDPGKGEAKDKPAEKPEPKTPPTTTEKPVTKPGPPAPREDKPAPREPDLAAEAGRLSNNLVKAAPAEQDKLLDSFKDSKGVVYTQALAAAIPRLNGDRKTKARLALAERLARMTAVTLRFRLKDDDLEIRRASALACAMKEEKSTVPDLIDLLEDKETSVARAAHAALKDLAGGKDFGPATTAGRDERKAAVRAWKVWWSQQKGN